MTISPRIWEFPTLPIQGQIFHVPGAAMEGGLTSGGARIVTPEPGGFAMLEIQLALTVTEWDYPRASWLMSKMNGQVFRIRLAPTPQIAWSRNRNSQGVPWDQGLLWSNLQDWEGDLSGVFTTAALAGSNQLVADLTGLNQSAQYGHVIGHGNSCYMIDEIEYDGDIATMTVTPPLRRDVAVNDAAMLRPWFLGRISNPSEVIAMYEAANAGHIQIGKIIFNEAIEP